MQNRRLTLAKTANGMDVNVYLKQRKKYGKEEEFKKHVPVEVGEVSHEEFKNMLEEEQRCISEPQEMHLSKVQCKVYTAGLNCFMQKCFFQFSFSWVQNNSTPLYQLSF